MKIAILHLSDIHLKAGSTNPILERDSPIVDAFQASAPTYDLGCLIISGDIAYSGSKAEYDIAVVLITKILNRLKLSQKPWEFIVVPGNHDCDASLHDDTREALLQKLYEQPTKEVDVGFIKNCLTVQIPYSTFASNQMNRNFVDPKEMLRYEKEITLNDFKILIRCFNTAWLSLKNEKQGSLLILEQLLLTTPDLKYDCAVTVFHHPYNWLQADNSRLFSQFVEERSDIILTGHEHGSKAFQKASLDGTSSDFYEGGVLQDSTYPQKSTFNVISIDVTEGKKSLTQYSWSKDFYKLSFEKVDEAFCRSKYLIRNEFCLASKFKDFLTDPGAQFTHPQIRKLSLHDIFVFPDLKEMSLDSTKLSSPILKHLDKLIVELKAPSRYIIFGDDKSGKSSISRVFFYLLHKGGDVPLLINGQQLKRQTINDLDAFLEKRFSEQYAGVSYQKYKQLSKDKKILIIDDFHLTELNRQGKHKVISKLDERVSRIVILGDNLLRLEQLPGSGEDSSWFEGARHFQIQDFGFVMRDELIKRWITLGLEDVITQTEVERKVRAVSHTMDSVLGNNLVPSQPLFILIILQQMEAHTSHKTGSGSYGYFYEYLITAVLAKTTHNLEIDLKYNYLSHFAYTLYLKTEKYLSEKDLYDLHSNYNRIYDLSLRSDAMRSELLDSGILTLNSNNGIEFRYKYSFYYFLARYISANLHEQEIIELVKSLTKTIHTVESANVLVFLSYLSKDPLIVDSLLETAKSVFKGSTPCDLLKDVAFLNLLQVKVPSITLHDGDASAHRREYLRHLDESQSHNSSQQEKGPADEMSKEAEDKVIDELMGINGALKTMDILGQILKNYSGSLKAELKTQLATECFSVGLRTLAFIYKFFETHLEAIVEQFSVALTKQKPDMSKEDINNASKSFLFVLMHLGALGIVKRIAYASGSEKLEKTYDHLRDSMSLASVDIIDLAIRLDHFSDFPEAKAVDVYDKVKNNFFAQQLVQRLVAMHFYLFHVDHSVKSRICNHLEITVRNEESLDEKNKIRR